jgi:hypothetical protein
MNLLLLLLLGIHIIVVPIGVFAQNEVFSNVTSVALEKNNDIHLEIAEQHNKPYYITRNEYFNEIKFKINLDTSAETQFHEENARVFQIHDFQQISKEKLLKKLKNKAFYSFENQELSVMTIINEQFFAVHSYFYFDEKEDKASRNGKYENIDFEYIDFENKKMRYYGSKFFAYSSLILNNNTMLFVSEAFCLLPLKRGIAITYEKREWLPSKEMKFKQPKRLSTYKGNIEQLYHIEKDNNKFKVSDSRFEKTYFFDIEAIIIDDNYIFVKRDGVFIAHDVFLKSYKRTPKLRAVFPEYGKYYGIQVLVGNKVKWLFNKGYCSSNQRKRQHIYYKQETCGFQNTFQNQDSIITKNGKESYLKYANFFLHLSDSHDFTFLNNKKYLLFPEMRDSLLTNRLIAKDKNGLHLFKINIIEEQLSLSPIIENMEVFDGKENYPFFKFKKNTLWGYYPLMTEAKFQSLDDFKFFFARFKIPDGKEGWMSIDGNIYFDE